MEVEVEAVGVVLLTLSLTKVEAVVEVLQVRRREGLEEEEGTSYLVVVEGRLRLVWMEVAAAAQLWELLKVVVEEHLFPGQEEGEVLSYVGAVEEAAVRLLMVVVEVVLAFAVHF